MAKRVVGICASAALVDWGPWHRRPSAVAPAALGAALQQAGAVVVLLAPGPDPGLGDLLSTLDALIVFDDAVGLDALLRAARDRGLGVLVLDASRVTPNSTVQDCAGAIAELGLVGGTNP